MGTIWQDVRFAARMLIRSPGFTVVVVLILALGIGVTTAVFSVVNGVLLRPLPYEDPDRLALLFSIKSAQRRPSSRMTFLDWKSQSQSFEDMAVSSFIGMSYRHEEGTDRVEGMCVSPNLFALLGLKPLIGRTFQSQESWPNHHYVVLGYDFWRQRLGGDESVLGRDITLSPELAPKEESYTVVGVMPPGVRFLNTRNPVLAPSETNHRIDLWVPLNRDVHKRRDSNTFWDVVGRLKRGVSIAQAQTEMDTIAGRVAQEHYSDPAKAPGVEVIPVHAYMVGEMRRLVLLAAGAAGFVMLIACANVANLLLVRSLGRRREMALRTTLGAGRLRLVRQMVTESMLLAVLGGASGLLFALWGTDVFRAIAPESVPRQSQVGIDTATLLFTGIAILSTGTIVGLIPAFRACRISLSEAIKQGDRGVTIGLGWRRWASLLVGGQLALSLILLIGAGLLINSLTRLLLVDPGYQTQNILTMNIRNVRDDSCHEMLQRAKSLPGVRAAALVCGLPLTKGLAPGGNVTPPDEVRSDVGRPNVKARIITPGYFKLMGIPFLDGRDFTEHDNLDAPRVTIISESLARLFWPAEDPVGKQFKASWADGMVEVVGVVGDTKSAALDAAAELETFFPGRQKYGRFIYKLLGFRLLVATESHPQSLVAPLRKVVWSVNKNAVICEIQTMGEIVAGTLAVHRFVTVVLSVFSLAAVILAVLGIYGVIAHSVRQRTHEIGIRMTLGASSSDVLQTVLAQGLKLTAIGLVIGLTGALALTRLISSFLFDISPTDPITFACVSFLLAGVTLLASYIPARRAARTDPTEALRYE